MKGILFLLFVFYSTLVLSQDNYDCGTSFDPDDSKIVLDWVKKIRTKQLMVTPKDSIVPVKFHIIGYSDSSSAIDSSDVYDELSIVNDYFKNAGIIFQHCGPIHYIFDNEYAEFEKITDETICDQEDEFNVLNIYFVPELFKMVDGSIVYLCGYAYLTGQNKNRLIMLNSCSTNGSTLAHEIGHYFSLLHTHSSSNGHELVNGANCSTAGDLLCDTPADPRLSNLNVNQNCVYVGNEQDALGDFYNPDPTNIMSYSRKHCRDFFSQEQLDQMSNYFYTYRNYLSCQFNGNFNDPEQDFQFSIYPNPANDQIAFSSNKVPSEPFDFSIIDVTGKLVIDGEIIKNSFINIESLQYGAYIFIISYDGIFKRLKFIKSASHF